MNRKLSLIPVSFRPTLIRWPEVARCVLLLLLCAAAIPALAGDGQGGRTLVSGNAVFSDCGSTFAAELDGDLNGCLEVFPHGFTCEELNGFAVYNEWGEEFFTDDDGVSTFRTTYTLEATLAQGFCESFDFSLQLTGGCEHTIFSGTGKFRGANGSITLSDIIPVPGVSGASNFLYHGYVKMR